IATAQSSGVRNADELRQFPQRLAAFTPEAADATRELKRFLHARVYNSGVLEEDRRRSTAMIRDLFQFFVTQPSRLPEPYADRARQRAPERVVCDYIAAMTDVYFRRTYAHVFATPLPK
ncbi:MAG: deoxyguanosinetriphosphate triphosphohydrolase, partial [Acidobacteriota bacterium]|nr:deoxyguanosinetriphosphate triphosphohydrolase [Acidobacteriota bacterium]